MAKDKQVATDFQKLITQGTRCRKLQTADLKFTIKIVSDIAPLRIQVASANMPRNLLQRSLEEIVYHQHLKSSMAPQAPSQAASA